MLKCTSEDAMILKLRRSCKTLAYMKYFPCYVSFNIVESTTINGHW